MKKLRLVLRLFFNFLSACKMTVKHMSVAMTLATEAFKPYLMVLDNREDLNEYLFTDKDYVCKSERQLYLAIEDYTSGDVIYQDDVWKVKSFEKEDGDITEYEYEEEDGDITEENLFEEKPFEEDEDYWMSHDSPEEIEYHMYSDYQLDLMSGYYDKELSGIDYLCKDFINNMNYFKLIKYSDVLNIKYAFINIIDIEFYNKNYQKLI